MKPTLRITSALLAGAGVSAAWAGDFDGSKLLICAPVEAISCAPGEACVKGRPDDIGAPAFMRIDFANKAIVGPKRTSPILYMDKNETGLTLQGNELGYAWTFGLDREDGSMTVTLVGKDGAFVLFGSCTPL